MVEGERGISGWERSSVSLVAIDGVWKCSAFVPTAINVAGKRKVWGRRRISRDKDLSEATVCP